MNDITFTGKFISSANVLERTGLKPRYNIKPVSFVQLDPASQNDLQLMKRVSQNWGNKNYAKNIYKSMLSRYTLDDSFFNYYVLTKQFNNFENLCPKDILGVALTHNSRPDTTFISYLQTRPKYTHKEFSFGAKIKNIGKTILCCLKKEFPQNDIGLLATDTSRPFYEKIGFANEKGNYMSLSREKKLL